MTSLLLTSMAAAHAVPDRPGAFSTLIPLPKADEPLAPTPLVLWHQVAGVSRYAPAPVPITMRAPPVRLTTAGHILCMLQSIGDGCGTRREEDPLIPIANDPNTGGAIGSFGSAYQDAGPVGRGLANNEAMPVGVK